MKTNRSRADPELGDLADKGLSRIQKYAKSNKQEDKLIGFNAILVFLILTLSTAAYFTPDPNDAATVLIMLFVGGIIGGALSLGYIRLIEIVAGIVSQNIVAMRWSISALFCGVSCSLIGFLFHFMLMVKTAFGILLLQLLLILILGFIGLKPAPTPVVLSEGNSVGFWTTLDRTSTIMGIINFVAWAGAIIIKLIG